MIITAVEFTPMGADGTGTCIYSTPYQALAQISMKT
jgi:hypothetical protein